ncbi:glycosyltransferase family 2 protein [Spirosoma sp. KCTC 42546]|uniref:glycosyltransferase family 2 protein n=1 Tax=Spirosoma sp. KCTC 42546 TaxID=2520506 RepID=UPI0011592D44|nr:glycosyltransferase family A protein [Spirosoma sp. KCTC 42546]QDK78142.1 glycosyltransferase family 2 protein [Spirosoma sp. KCTC 42546]
MKILSNPEWIKQYEYPFRNLDQVPLHLFDSINSRLDERISTKPLVSIIVIAYNEEINILRAISTLSSLTTDIPFEIVAINNNSTDKTQETIEKLHVKRFFQPIQGWGPARQLGQEMAIGKYILLADADCLYPPNWLDEMMKKLQQPDVVCVYGRYSFIALPEIPRWQFLVYETLKDVIAEFRHYKRPYLNSYGISMGYIREAGLRAGYIQTNLRGDEGRLCFDMMQYGRVVQMRTRSARVWTAPRTLLRDGTLWQCLKIRIHRELNRALSYLTPHPPHDTKKSFN